MKKFSVFAFLILLFLFFIFNIPGLKEKNINDSSIVSNDVQSQLKVENSGQKKKTKNEEKLKSITGSVIMNALRAKISETKHESIGLNKAKVTLTRKNSSSKNADSQTSDTREFVTYTNEDGLFEFPNLPDGKYLLKVSKNGYYTCTLDGSSLRTNKFQTEIICKPGQAIDWNASRRTHVLFKFIKPDGGFLDEAHIETHRGGKSTWSKTTGGHVFKENVYSNEKYVFKLKHIKYKCAPIVLDVKQDDEGPFEFEVKLSPISDLGLEGKIILNEQNTKLKHTFTVHLLKHQEGIELAQILDPILRKKLPEFKNKNRQLRNFRAQKPDRKMEFFYNLDSLGLYHVWVQSLKGEIVAHDVINIEEGISEVELTPEIDLSNYVKITALSPEGEKLQNLNISVSIYDIIGTSEQLRSENVLKIINIENRVHTVDFSGTLRTNQKAVLTIMSNKYGVCSTEFIPGKNEYILQYKPAANLRVLCENLSNNESSKYFFSLEREDTIMVELEAQADENGKVVFQNQSPGQYKLKVRAAGGFSYQLMSKTITLSSGENEESFIFPKTYSLEVLGLDAVNYPYVQLHSYKSIHHYPSKSIDNSQRTDVRWDFIPEGTAVKILAGKSKATAEVMEITVNSDLDINFKGSPANALKIHTSITGDGFSLTPGDKIIGHSGKFFNGYNEIRDIQYSRKKLEYLILKSDGKIITQKFDFYKTAFRKSSVASH